MNKLATLSSLACLVGALALPAHALSGTTPVAPQGTQQVGTDTQGTPTTPAAALSWQEREKARAEQKKRAEKLREQQINKEETNTVPPEESAAPSAQ